MENNQTHRSSTVHHALSFLTLFLKYNNLRLTDAERELGLSKTAVFRLAATMTDQGYLIKDGQTKRYYLGPLMFQLVRKNQEGDLVSIARPFMQEMVDLIKETVAMTVRTGDYNILLATIDSPQIVKVSLAGWVRFNNMYSSSFGKIHLAYMSPLERKGYLKRTRIMAETDRTITDQDALEMHLSSVRENGYSTSLGERYNDTVGFAAPIWGMPKEPVAALSVFMPSSRYSPENQLEIIELLVKYAKNISQALSGHRN